MNNRHLILPLAVALALASPGVLAMGLGQLQVKSGLNQPLLAEIPIISATPSELDQLDVRLASPEAFSRVGLERPGELTANLQFSVGKNARGQPVIRVSTPGRFSEPVLSFLIEAEWGKGTVTREYTALIDPPYIAAAIIQPMLSPTTAVAPIRTAAPVAAPPVVTEMPQRQPEAAQTAPAPEPEPIAAVATPLPRPTPNWPTPVAPRPSTPATPMPAAEPQPSQKQQTAAAPVAKAPPAFIPAPAPVAAAPASPGPYGPVSPGQTLWSIANSVRPDPGISINQMMVALLRANPDAFAQDNINLLKRGSVLRVPGQEEVGRLSAADAAVLVSQQASAWRAPRKAIPQPAETADAQPVAAVPKAESKPKPTAKPDPKPKPDVRAETAQAAAADKPGPPRVAAAKAVRPSSRLEIVPPSGNAAARGAQSGAAAGAGGTELRAELAQTREELAARTSEVIELKSRVGELEKQESDRQRLIEMQNSQMKDLQDRLKQMEAEQAAAPVANSVQPAIAPQPVAAVEPAKPAAPSAVAAANSDSLESKPWYLSPFVLGGAILLLLGGLVLAMRRSKLKPEIGEPTTRRLSDDDALRASMAKTREAGERIKQEPVSTALPDIAAGIGATPPADAELEALKDAVRSRPQDLETHVSLLRLLHSRGNASDYEVAAQAMRLQVPSTMDPRWREAVIMGASLIPENTLFSPAGWNSPRYSEPEPPTQPVPAAPVKVFDPPIDFGLDEVDEIPASAGSPATLTEVDLDDHSSVFGSSLGTPPTDIHRSEAELMVEDEASATRIELAQAYLDIGDLDGARSMLEEVLADGGPAAQALAGRILKEIG